MKNLTKAQGAMEYLMSYGWSIVVVLIVGVAVWHLGILEINTSSPPTSSGFGALKPLLASCYLGDSISYHTIYDGLQCQFLNTAGVEVNISDISITVDNQQDTCQFIYVDTHPVYNTAPRGSKFFRRYCITDEIDSCLREYVERNAFPNSPRTCDPATGGPDDECFLFMDKETVFTVVISDYDGSNQCAKMESGGRYTFFIDITYYITIGEIMSEKHSTGTVQVTAT
jgi:hypothetical protein